MRTYHEGLRHISGDKMYHTILENTIGLIPMWTFMRGAKLAFFAKALSIVKPRPPVKALPVETTICQRWHVDAILTIYLYRHPQQATNVLVDVDSFSLWSVLLPAKTTGAEDTAILLYDYVLCNMAVALW